jgi:hypothetical protein
VATNDLKFIPALNGLEIINDLCGLITEKLSADCNLREIDGYAGGYKATVKIHIEAFGLDQANVDYEVEANEVVPDPENPLQEPDVVLDVDMDIPVETNLEEVRNRSAQVASDFEIKPQIELTPEGPVETPQPSRRKYTRRLRALASPQGGATGELDE